MPWSSGTHRSDLFFPSMGLLIGLSALITVILIGGLDVNHVPGASRWKDRSDLMYVQMLFSVGAVGWIGQYDTGGP